MYIFKYAFIITIQVFKLFHPLVAVSSNSKLRNAACTGLGDGDNVISLPGNGLVGGQAGEGFLVTTASL